MFRPDYLVMRNFVSFEEQRYEFINGKPVLVIGDNKDDPSQKGNGAGKSIMQDGIAVAFTGQPVRNVSSSKKLVRRGQEFAEIEYAMHNTMYRCEIKILRKLYAGGKSQEVKLYENGEQIVLSDVNEYNKRIFEYLAISKDDFFNFYLITKDYYKPFFRVGDTVKKDIINRFSGADKVDGVDAAIDDDVKDAELKITAIQRLIDVNSGKQEIIGENITKLSTAETDEQKAARVGQLTWKQSNMLESAENYNHSIEQEELMLNAVLKEKETFEPEDFDFAITLEKGSITKIDQKIAKLKEQLPLIAQEFAPKKAEIEEYYKGIIQLIADERTAIIEAENMLGDINASLAGTIHCPKCAHEFSVADHTFDIEAAKRTKQELESIIAESKESIKSYEAAKIEALADRGQCDADMASRQADTRDEIASEQNRLNETQKKIGEFEVKKREQARLIADLDDRIKNYRDQVAEYMQTQMTLIENAEKLQAEIDAPGVDNSAAIEEQEGILLNYIDEAGELADKLAAAQQKLQEVKEWYGNFKSFKSYLANQSIRNVQDYTNLYLQQMGSNLSIEIEGYKKQSTGKLKEQINTLVCRDGLPEDEYGTYSGGERGRIDIACILAIQHLINLNATSGGLDLFIADEIFDSIDSLGLEFIFKGLLQIDRTVLFISQVQINALAENTLVIRKENKVSRIFAA